MILQIHRGIRTSLGLDLVFCGSPFSIDHIWHFPGYVFVQNLEISLKNGLLFFQNVRKVNNLQITS